MLNHGRFKRPFSLFLPALLIFLLQNLDSIAQMEFEHIPGTPFDGVANSSIAFADVDGDSDQDVLITGEDTANQPIAKLYTNDSSGHFTLVQGTPFDGVSNSSIAFADVDGDSDQDVLITGQDTANQPIAKLYTNDSSGHFTLVQGTPFDGVSNSSIAFADVDGDGDQDVLITGDTSTSKPITQLYTNDGSGNFTLVPGTPFDAVYEGSIAFADVEGDGDQDVLITGDTMAQPLTAITQLYTNDGNGNFSLVPGTPFDGVESSSIAFADVEGDGDQDVIITGSDGFNQGIAQLYTNDGSGNYSFVPGTPPDTLLDGVSRSSIAFADVEGDGDQDVLITGWLNLSLRITNLYTNDGSGHFTWEPCVPFDGVSNGSIAFADVDGDSDQDVLITGKSSLNPNQRLIAKLYRNINITCSGKTSFTTDVDTACDSFTWIDGNTYTSSNNTATDTLTNEACCDSVINLDLTIKNSTTGTDVVTACDSFTWIDGNTYTSSNNTATDTLTNAAGCDSVVNLALSIPDLSPQINTNGLDLSIADTFADYQWFIDGNAISGATSHSHKAAQNGIYHVRVENAAGCQGYSDTVQITSVGFAQPEMGSIKFYPNPFANKLTVVLPDIKGSSTLRLWNVQGRVVYRKEDLNQGLQVIPSDNLSSGLYLLEVQHKQGVQRVKVVKE